MAYKCLNCGNIFERGEQARWIENLGEYWGLPCLKEMSGCPCCFGAYEETYQCELCGSEHAEDELYGGVCEECIDNYKSDFKTCYEISLNAEKVNVKINALLASLLDDDEIEEILIDFVKEHCKDADCTQFIEDDKHWFGEQLAKEVRKNEDKKG